MATKKAIEANIAKRAALTAKRAQERKAGSSGVTKPRHTPGPWHPVKVNHPGNNHYSIRDSENNERAIVDASYAVTLASLERTEANARLISAAPELLEALKAVLSVADRKTVEFDKARAAIAKATGK